MQSRKWLPAVLCGALLLSVATAAYAQAYPERTIRIVSPAAAGGGNDILARLAGQKLSEAFGKPVVVENRPGGGTIIGTEMVARAAPDGYTLIVVTTNFIINPGLVKQLPYDSIRDLAPVSLLASAPLVLVVHPSVPAKSLREFIALAKARAGQINYASSGNGTAGHLAGVLLGATAHVDITHIPYKSTAPALTDLLGGQVQALFVSTPSVLPHLKNNRLRALAVTSAARSSQLLQVPTLAESGVPGYEVTQIYGVLAPGGTPADIIARLNAVLARAVKMPDVAERLQAEGAEPVGSSPGEFAQYIRAEIAKWVKVIAQSGARVD